MLVTWEQLQRKVRRSKSAAKRNAAIRNARICPACQECYEPCVEVAIIGHNIWHLVPFLGAQQIGLGLSAMSS
jgi:hypothetical protein